MSIVARPPQAAPAGPCRFLVRLTGLLRPYWLRCAGALVAILAHVAFSLALPICYKLIFDRAIGQGDSRFLWMLLAGMGAGFLLVTLGELLQGRLFSTLGASVTNDLRLAMFSHLQRLPIGFYGSARVGDLISRFTNDLNAIDRAVTSALYKLLFHGLFVLSGTAILFFLEWRLALIALIALPLAAVGPRILGRRTARAGYARKEEEAAVASLVQESILAQKVIRAFGLRSRFGELFAAGLERLHSGVVSANHLGILMGQSANTGILIIQLLVMGAGAYLALIGVLSPGDLVAFLGLLLGAGASAKALTSFLPDLVQAAAGQQRIDELLAEPAEEEETGPGQPLPRFGREIRFSQVSFSYTGDERSLDEISFTIPAGQSVAFIGRSGSGKTTVLNLLARFYTSTEGTITVDGRDVRQISQEALRAQIGTVFQDTFLFNTTIGENIRQGRLDATDAELEEAAKAAEIHDFISRLPQGYDTPVGEMGGYLSGGQRQRLALARAILRNPSILILDEATSALDPATEAAVNATLEKLARRCTLISVTHRLSAAINMDRIFVLDEGKLVEQGSHRELLNRKGIYYRMWQDFTLELTQDAMVGDVGRPLAEVELSLDGDVDQLTRRIRQLEGEAQRQQQELERLQILNQRWAQLAGTDRLTGLPNKIAFIQALAPQVIQQARRGAEPVGFVLFSGDNLGLVNEQHGRDAGDQVLRGLAEYMQSILKGEELLAHIDGSNFAVVFYPADLERVRQRAEQLRAGVEAHPFSCADTTTRITISVGATTLPGDASTEPRQAAEETLDRLNAALYQAKRSGGNRIEAIA